MTDLTTVLRTSIDDEPPLGFGPDDVVRRGRRARRRRTAVVSGVSAVTVLAVAAGAVALGDRPAARIGTPAGQSPTASPASPGPTERPIDGANFATVVADLLGVRLGQAGARYDDSGLSLHAAVEDADGPGALSVQIVPLGGMRFPTSCADFEPGQQPDGRRGDGYFGPCTDRVLPDGSILVERSGRTEDGYAKAMAVLVRPNRSGLIAEAVNQRHNPTPAPIGPDFTIPGVTRADPPLTSARLVALLLDLAPRIGPPE